MGAAASRVSGHGRAGQLHFVLTVVLATVVLSLMVFPESAPAYTNPSKDEIRVKLYEAAVARNIPPEILYGIAYQESGWRQFDANGYPLISYDGIGIGIMQISSYWDIFDKERLKYDIDYNIAAGADILLDKWQWVPSIGDDAMNCYEHWFYAAWAYNGWVADNPYPYTIWGHIADGPVGWWPGVPVTPVPREWLVNGFGVQVPTPQPAHYWEPPLTTYFSWYDGLYSRNWVLVANAAGAEGDVAAGITVAGMPWDLSPFTLAGQNPGVVPPGNTMAADAPGVIGGPVKVHTSREAIISQRMLFGDSIEEVVGAPAEGLSHHYYWPWYDMQSEGYADWIMVSNPNGEDIHYRVVLAGAESAAGVIAPGKSASITLADAIGGPLEVEAAYDAGFTTPAPLIASQRVLTGYGAAFNEAPGTPAEDLSSDYYWTWYDSVAGQNWVILANPNTYPVPYQIEIGTGGCDASPPAGTACENGTLDAAGSPDGGDVVTPTFPDIQTGPVRVTSSGGDIIASQRVVFGASFGETPGYPAGSLATRYHWTWYDQASPGMENWILVANAGAADITYSIRVNGVIPAGYGGLTLAAGEMDTPVFPGWIGGPVEVVASGPVIASQRVLHNGYFNEVNGVVLEAPSG